MKKLFLLTAAALAAVFIYIALTLPPRRVTLAPDADGTVPGIIHVHTNRSDGLSSPEDAAAAAGRAGLKFLVFTDHGDATRAPDPPIYRSGVLCLDGVEISTSGGHYVAIDMPASPYPLGGEARDVVEDVRRLGGFGIVAHPDSPKPQLQWTDWTLPFDGIELLNPDTSWRLLARAPGWAPTRRLLTAALDYSFRPPEVMASLIQPTAVLERWEALARRRRVVTIAGADAHAKLTLRSADPGDSPFVLRLPGYEQSFRLMSVRVRTDQALTGRAAPDAAMIMRALRNGHLYTAIDAIATPPWFEFTATNALGTVHEGDVLGAGGPVLLHVQSNAPGGFVTLVHDGTRTLAVARDTQDLVVHGGDAAAVYWAEIVSPVGEPRVTWIRSNPIYVRARDTGAAPGATPAEVDQGNGQATVDRAADATMAMFDGRTTSGWAVEHDAHSVAALDVAQGPSGGELRYRFGLADGPAVGQYTSLVLNLPDGVGASNRFRFTIRAERSMRISLQARDAAANRWQRSVYVDLSAQERTIAFDDVLPVGSTGIARGTAPSKEALRGLMFVVDTTNTKPGTSGRIWIRTAVLAR